MGQRWTKSIYTTYLFLFPASWARRLVGMIMPSARKELELKYCLQSPCNEELPTIWSHTNSLWSDRKEQIQLHRLYSENRLASLSIHGCEMIWYIQDFVLSYLKARSFYAADSRPSANEAEAVAWMTLIFGPLWHRVQTMKRCGH